MIRLTYEPIDPTQVFQAVRSPACGAAVLFLGTVREMTAGQQTLRLEYEAFPAMAEAQIQQLITEACERWPVQKIAVVHRLGTLELEEISIAVAVSTPHRADAFEAGRWMIDRFKEVVPVWKKEHWADGTTEWVHPGVPARSATEAGAADDEPLQPDEPRS